MPDHESPDPLDEYWNKLGEDTGVRSDGRETSLGIRFPCPCCGYLTLTEPHYGTFVICDVCFWEDDDVQLLYPDSAVGANASNSPDRQPRSGEAGWASIRTPSRADASAGYPARP